MTSSSDSSFANESSEEQEQLVATAIANSVALVIVPRHIAEELQSALVNVTPRPLPSDCRDEEREFLREFEERVTDLVREIRQEFPYKQTIQWSIEYGNDRQHSFHIDVKALRRPLNQ